MREDWQRLPLGKIAFLDIDRVAVQGEQNYPIAGVLNAGKGLFPRDPVQGSATNYPALHRLRSDQLVMRKLTAWEGPITIVDEEYDGYFVSPEFPTFTLNQHFIEPSYMRLICQTPGLWEAMKNTSTGTVQRRKRVSPSALLSIDLDLPPLQEQRRIVDLIGAVGDVGRAADVHAAAALQTAASHEAAVCAAAEGVTHTTLGQIAEIAGGVTKDRKKEQGEGLVEVPYLRVANVQRGFLDLSAMATIKVPPSTVERLRLRPGDILLNEGGDRDKLGRGWVWEGQLAHCVHQNHVFRARINDKNFDPKFVSIWANTFGQRWFYENGGQTTGIASISMSTLKRFPVPKLQRSKQVEAISTSEAARSTAYKAQSLGKAARGLRAALLSKLLSGERQIPASYDVLLETA